MATQEQIFSLRLKIADPPGFIGFMEVANAAALPATPASQTAYLQADTGEYKATDLTSGATPSDYEAQTLAISDAVLGGYIDSYGEDSAVCQAIKQIIANLGREMRIKKLDGGADSTEYQSLSDLMSYYKDLLSICSDNTAAGQNASTGRMFKTNTPEIAGGNI